MTKIVGGNGTDVDVDGVFSIDLANYCPGFIHALHLAELMVRCDDVENVLIVASTDYTDMISVDPLFYAEFSDRFRQNSEAVQQFSCQGGQFQAPQLNAFLWGCGAGAIVVGVSSEKNCIIRYEGFGSRRIKKDSYGIGENTNKEGFTALDGKAIYMFAVSEIPKFMKQFVSKCGLSLTDIDVIVPHQPNPRILEKLIERLGIRPDKMLVSCDQLGNMIGASVPITYHLNRQSGKIKRGSKVLFCSFGDSYLTGAAILFDEF